MAQGVKGVLANGFNQILFLKTPTIDKKISNNDKNVERIQ